MFPIKYWTLVNCALRPQVYVVMYKNSPPPPTPFYNELRNMLSSITNTLLDDRAWLQASLPVKSGGLGIRCAVHLVSSALLASFAGCRELTFTILPPRFQELPLSIWNSAIAEWSTGHNEPPSGPMSHRQKSWDLCTGLYRLPMFLLG